MSSDAIPDSAQRWLVQAMLPLAASEPFAAAVELGVRTEAVWRRLAELQLSVTAAAFGTTTRLDRRRAKEHAHAARLHPELNGQVRRPVVNWHESGSGPVLLLLNGWTASGLLWPAQWLRRLERAFHVIRIDNRGTGWSRSAPRPFTVGDLADDARDVLRARGIDRATVLGLSMGGMIAQELALRYPGYVERLVLVATMPPKPAQIMPDLAPFQAALSRPAPGQPLADFFAQIWGGYTGPEFAASHPDILDELIPQIMQRVTPRELVLDQVRAIASWHGAGRLRRLGVPTTVVHGNRDALMPVGNGMRLSRLIPHAQYLELAGVGHLVPHEAGDELLQLLGASTG